MDRPQAYSLGGYGDMINDGPRIEAYVSALQSAVRPGCRVLDIGAGTGIFSLLSCQFGASRAVAVEPDDSIRIAEAIADANGYRDRIEFHQTVSTTLQLPEPADVVISDLRGVLPLLQHHIPSIIDARRRLLAPGGRQIPECDTIWGAVVEIPEQYARFERPWINNNYGLDMRAGHLPVINTWRRVHVGPDRLLVEPQRWATLDYRTIDSPHVDARLSWTVQHPGTAHGLLVWFDTQLLGDIGFSNAPGQPELIYGQAFFPFQEAVALAAGERIQVRLAANLVAGEYVWRWETEVLSAAEAPTRRCHFQQSTFLAGVLEAGKLRRAEANFVPRLSPQGESDRLLLSLIDGQTSLGDIARRAAEHYPEQFPRWQDALTRVARLVDNYGG